MIGYTEALQKILDNADRLSPVQKPVSQSLFSVMASDAVAPFDLPMFDNSAMDGYALQAKYLVEVSDDIPALLTCQGTIQAGDTHIPVLNDGHVLKIFTGAPIPKGADAVVMKEYCTDTNDGILITDEVIAGENIRQQGEEFKTGDCVLPLGTVVTPPVMGLLASLGYDHFSVFQKPSIGILITGNELVAAGNALERGQIYESNSIALKAALQSIGIDAVETYFAKDNQEETHTVFEHAINQHDVVITVGGVSVGDFDFVKEVVENAGIETVFWRIAIKPGKPVYFGKQTGSHKLVFGLPGNPVSALVTFHQLVQPALLKMMGYPQTGYLQHSKTTAILSKTLKKKSGRAEFVRGIVTPSENGDHVEPTLGQQSHMLGGLSLANALIHFPESAEQMNEGDTVEINALQWMP